MSNAETGSEDDASTKSTSFLLFTAGWRPAIGWVCTLAIFCQYIVRPVAQWVGIAIGHPLPTLPGIDDNLWQLMLGMLGLGSLRTLEKVRGAEGNR